MRNETEESLIFLIVFSTCVVLVNGQCFAINNAGCNWRHEEGTQLTWQYVSGSGAGYVELTKCQHPNCGNANLVSTVQSPSTADTSVTIEYKIYGTSNVFLKLYLKRDDQARLYPLFEKYGNYGQLFPTSWTSTLVTIPKTDVPYRLMLKGYIPYADAYLAVLGIRLESAGPSPAESNVKPVEHGRNNQGVQETGVTLPTRKAVNVTQGTREREDDTLGYLRNDAAKIRNNLLILIPLLAIAANLASPSFNFSTKIEKRRPGLGDKEDSDIVNQDYEYELGEQNQLENGRYVMGDDFNFAQTVVVQPNVCK